MTQWRWHLRPFVSVWLCYFYFTCCVYFLSARNRTLFLSSPHLEIVKFLPAWWEKKSHPPLSDFLCIPMSTYKESTHLLYQEIMKYQVVFWRLATLDASHVPFWSVKHRETQKIKKMEENNSVANGGTRAVGWLVQGHWTQIHFLMLQWPQHDSLVPKVMPYPSFSANQWSTCTPALPHPLTTYTVSLNEGSHPPACTPSWASEVSSFTVSGDTPPTSFHASMELLLSGLLSALTPHQVIHNLYIVLSVKPSVLLYHFLLFLFQPGYDSSYI